MKNKPKSIPLLATKLFIPSVRPILVERNQLHRQLDEAQASRLIVVAAPAGFGKTTLVASWLARQDTPIAWISLDRHDNSPLLLLAYIVGALQNIDADICETAEQALQLPDPPPSDVILTYLINDLACLERTCLLVLDDYHVIQEPAIHAAMDFLINNAPASLQIVIISRRLPEVALPKLRARHQLTEIDAPALRFTYDETVEFLTRVMGLTLTAAEIAALEKRAEGWVTGLQLAALSIQGHAHPAQFVAGLTGADRLITDYLVDEVLSQQPEPIQQFLIRTSLLKRFCAPLCDSLPGIAGAQSALQHLERSSLFLVPLDNQREWYRYHHLFADMLRSRLEKQRPDLVPILCQQAVDWHSEQGLIEDAIDYAMEGRFYEQAAALIVQVTQKLRESGKRAHTVRWVGRLPADIVRRNRVLWIQYVMALFYFSRYNQALDFMQTALHDEALASALNGEDLAISRGYRSALLAAVVLHTRLDAPRARQLAQEALALLPEKEFLGRGIAWGFHGCASLIMGDIKESQQALEKAVTLIRQTGTASISLVFMRFMAKRLACEGQLRQANRLFQQAYQYAHDLGVHESEVFANVLIGLGNLHFEWNDLALAEELIEQGSGLSKNSHSIEQILECHWPLLRLRLLQKRLGDIEAWLAYAEGVAANYDNPPYAIDRIESARAHVALTQGRLASALRWQHDFEQQQQGVINDMHWSEWLTVARVHLANKQTAAGIAILKQLLDRAKAQRRGLDEIRAGVVLVGAFQEAGQTEQALAELTRLLTLAQPERYLRTFVDEGPSMRALLEHLLKTVDQREGGNDEFSSPTRDYLREILAAFDAGTPDPMVDAVSSASVDAATLTPREQEVVQLLAEGLSYADITARLVITENTLKSHIKNSYRKLNVKNRTQAVLKATELGLLD